MNFSLSILPHVGAIGFVFQVTVLQDGVAKDVSGAIAKKICLKSPDAVVEYDAAFLTDGTDGILTYTTTAAELDRVGIWRIAARVDDLTTESQTFEVIEAIC